MADIGSRARWSTLVAMTLANSMILVDQTAVPLAIPHTIAALDGSLSISQWILTANILPLAAFMVFAGRLGDQLGLRRVFLAGALLFIGSSALAGAAQDMAWLITVRATQGVGAALMLPTTLAIVSAVFPEQDREGRLVSWPAPRRSLRRWDRCWGTAYAVHRLAGGVLDQRPAGGRHHRAHPAIHPTAQA